jgi:hypothetical protein
MKPLTDKSMIAVAIVVLALCVVIALCSGCTLPGKGGQVEYLRKGDPAPFAGYLWSGPETPTNDK